jgi:uncharacterized protein
MDIEYRPYADCDLKGSAVVIGFPSLGLVSSIATNFLSRELKMDLVGGFTSSQFPPYCVLQGGRPMPQIRIFSGSRDSDPEKPGVGCGRVSIITTEFLPKPDQNRDIAMAVFDWIVDNGIGTVITLDGIPMFTPDKYELYAAGSTEHARSLIDEYGIEHFDDGMVRGVSGTLLYECSVKGIDAITLMGSAKSELPDPFGAARLLDPLKRMFPEINVDTEPLYEEAEALNKRINSRPTQQAGSDDSILYG